MGAQTIGLYEIERKLGEGGFGVVYIARDTRLGRRAAIKQLLPELSGNREIVERFFNEAKAAASISHPGIVEIYDVGWHTDGSAYFAMKLLEGDTVGARQRERGMFEARIAATIGRQVALALVAAHERGIVHRDLKPDNIMLIADEAVAIGERAVVLDFGIAKLFGEHTGSKTRTGMVMGTPLYMSPEQCRGAGEVDAKSDVYSLGCILFEMLCGRPPFVADGPGAVMGMHQFVEVKPLRTYRADVPEELEALVMRALAKEPAERMTMAELAAALKPIAERAELTTPQRTVVGHAGGQPQVTPPEQRATPPEHRVPPEQRVTPPEQRVTPPEQRVTPEPPVEKTRQVTPEVARGPVSPPPPARSRTPLLVGGGVAVASLAALGFVVTRDSSAPSTDPVAATPLERGEQLVRKNCIACHSLDGSTAIGPTLRDAWGTQRVQEDGTEVVMDEAYFREALVRPNARVLRGFPATMPVFEKLSDADIAAMITYVKTLAPSEAPPVAGGAVEQPDALPVITTPTATIDAAVAPDCEPLLAAGRLDEVERCAKELAVSDAAAAAALRARAHEVSLVRAFDRTLAAGRLALARGALSSMPAATRPDAERRLVAAEDQAVGRLADELRRLVAPDCVAFTERQRTAREQLGDRVVSQARLRVACTVERRPPTTTGPVVITKSSVQIMDTVSFAEGAAKPSSFAVADQVAAVLAGNPELRVEIQGHTSATGSDADNQKLSVARANAVRQRILEKGIDGSRLVARGYGEAMPIASNTTPGGRARNNRVEFRVLGD